MKKSIKIGVIALSVLMVGVAAALFGIGNKAVAPMEEKAASVAVLKSGANGEEVREVQRRLKEWG